MNPELDRQIDAAGLVVPEKRGKLSSSIHYRDGYAYQFDEEGREVPALDRQGNHIYDPSQANVKVRI